MFFLKVCGFYLLTGDLAKMYKRLCVNGPSKAW